MQHVTRRVFLRSAALAGAGFALPRCRSAAPGGTPDVVVLGAGMAGLTASRELLRAGLDVVVLEARDRVGGRMHTLEQPSPHGVEIGAQMIHGSSAPVLWELIRAMGVQARPMRGWGDRWLQQDDGRFVASDAALVGRVRERLQAAYRNYAGPDVTLEAFLDSVGLEGLQREIAWEDALSWSAEPDEISLEAALRDSPLWDDYLDQNFQVVGGYGRFAERLAQPLGERLLLACTVRGIEWGEGGVRVSCEREGRRETLRARCALVTLPIGILRSDSPAFAPALPEWKRRSIDALAMGRVVVVPMLFRDAFWRERAPERLGWTSQGGRVSFWDPHGPDFGEPSLQAWLTGRAAQQVSDLGREAGLAQVLAWLERALPGAGARERLAWWGMGDWVRDPFARGAYSYTRPGGYGQRAVLARPVEDRLFFAGEATVAGPHYQTVHGAAMSARRAAREILTALGFETSAPALAAGEATPGRDA